MHRLGRCISEFRRAAHIVILVLLSAVALTGMSFGQARDNNQQNLILSRLNAGAEANLSDPAFGSNHLDIDFVSKLLSGGIKIEDGDHHLESSGIVISYAIFDDQLTIGFDVPYRVEFRHCEFRDGIDFSGSVFKKDLVFEGDSFGIPIERRAHAATVGDSDDDAEVAFINATVKGTLIFHKPLLYAPMDFTKAQVRELDINDATFEWRGNDADLDLTAAHVDTDLSLSVETRQPRSVHAQFLNVGGSASLGDSSGFYATHDFDLTYSHLQNFAIHALPDWIANAHDNSLSLDGFSFQEVFIPDDKGKSDPFTLLQLLNSSKFRYSVEPYLALEQNLTNSGHSNRANQVYINMRNRQRRQRLQNPVNTLSAWIAWLADWFVYLLIGYGREPWRAALMAGLFTVLGAVIFRPGRMAPQASEDGKPGDENATKSYNAFWYSLDVLAPAIELGADKAWQPDPKWSFGRNYSYIHRILGWVLVPLILAAISGIIH